MTRHGRWAWALMLLALVAQAKAPEEVLRQVQVSMLVTGSVDIERDGSVGGHAIDKVEALPKGVVDMVDGAIRSWRFEPVTANGQPVAARSRFSLRVVGNQVDDNQYTLRIAGEHFGEDQDDSIPARAAGLRRRAIPRTPRETASAARYTWCCALVATAGSRM